MAACRPGPDPLILFLMPATYHPLFQLCNALFQLHTPLPLFPTSSSCIYRGLRATQNRQSPHPSLSCSTVFLFFLYILVLSINYAIVSFTLVLNYTSIWWLILFYIIHILNNLLELKLLIIFPR